MKKILEIKKREVIQLLLKQLSHKNKDDLEVSLNAQSVLIELIETEKTFSLFFENDAKIIDEIIRLALDPLNHFNQPYLLNLLLIITKQIRQIGQVGLFAPKDEDEEA